MWRPTLWWPRSVPRTTKEKNRFTRVDSALAENRFEDQATNPEHARQAGGEHEENRERSADRHFIGDAAGRRLARGLRRFRVIHMHR